MLGYISPDVMKHAQPPVLTGQKIIIKMDKQTIEKMRSPQLKKIADAADLMSTCNREQMKRNQVYQVKSLCELAWNVVQKGQVDVAALAASLQQSQQLARLIQQQETQEQVPVHPTQPDSNQFLHLRQAIANSNNRKMRPTQDSACEPPVKRRQYGLNTADVTRALFRSESSSFKQAPPTSSSARQSSYTLSKKLNTMLVKNRPSSKPRPLRPLEAALAESTLLPTSRAHASNDNCKWMSVEEIANRREVQRPEVDDVTLARSNEAGVVKWGGVSGDGIDGPGR